MNGIEKAIETLKMENELMQFNPMTGEIKPIELQNQDNQDLYNANLIAISALENQQEFNEYMEYMKQLAEDETKPLTDREFADKFVICCECFVMEVENE
jgi:hypothetical protein